MSQVTGANVNLTGWGPNKYLIAGKCGHCQHMVRFADPEDGRTSLHFEQSVPVEDEGYLRVDHFFVMGLCPNPECQNATIVYRVEQGFRNQSWEDERSVVREEIIHPVGAGRRIDAEEVPKPLRTLFEEAGRVEAISPISTAFIGRRILEQVLRDRLKSKKPLVQLIDLFLTSDVAPPGLHELMHHVRGFGNIAGHPSQSDDGEWISVDHAEASYILDVIEELLDFVYVRPARQLAMQQRLEMKKRGELPPRGRPGEISVAGAPERSAPSHGSDDDLPF